MRFGYRRSIDSKVGENPTNADIRRQKPVKARIKLGVGKSR
jgi:hypothetical protein